MAVNRVEKLLRKTAKALDTAKIRYAVVGGNAVAAWVATVDPEAVRATKDLDVLVRRKDLPDVTAALRTIGMVPVEVMGVMMFVDRRRPNPRSGVHIVFANEHIRPHYAYPAPSTSRATLAAEGFLVLDLPALVRMKLQAFRRVDQVHIEDMLAAGLIGARMIRGLPADLRKRLRSIQETMPD